MMQKNTDPAEIRDQCQGIGRALRVHPVRHEEVPQVRTARSPPSRPALAGRGESVEKGGVHCWQATGQLCPQMVADHVVQGQGPARYTGVEAEKGQVGHLPEQAEGGGLVEAGSPLPQTGCQRDRYRLVLGEDPKLRKSLLSTGGTLWVSSRESGCVFVSGEAAWRDA
ncbi:hypothetical protein [Streptomyces sp. CS065A]|uniref:hypothetical protein n=1 Tax=unclassified Streptomyces TaxID=2593676 RepID=UPI0013A570A2|nr:hypothetical protein [Streptomyces sp. CS065A]